VQLMITERGGGGKLNQTEWGGDAKGGENGPERVTQPGRRVGGGVKEAAEKQNKG